MNRRRFFQVLSGAGAAGLVIPQLDWEYLLQEALQPERTHFIGSMGGISKLVLPHGTIDQLLVENSGVTGKLELRLVRPRGKQHVVLSSIVPERGGVSYSALNMAKTGDGHFELRYPHEGFKFTVNGWKGVGAGKEVKWVVNA